MQLAKYVLLAFATVYVLGAVVMGLYTHNWKLGVLWPLTVLWMVFGNIQ